MTQWRCQERSLAQIIDTLHRAYYARVTLRVAFIAITDLV
jgi:hypothetical protein